MWSGGTFHYALRRLLTIYFRCKLAPERERRYKEYVTKKSAECSQRKEAKLQNPSCCTQRQRIRKEKKNVKKCLERIISATTVESKSLWEERRDRAIERLERLEANLRASKKKAMVQEVESADEDALIVNQDGDAIDIITLLNHGVSATSVLEIALNSDLAQESSKEKETAGAKILKLVAFTKQHLCNNVNIEDLGQILENEWKGSLLLSKEKESVQYIFSLLSAYMPPKNYKASIALQLPIVVLSNVIQTASGYEDFTRKICPIISPAHIHALPIDAPTIFEMMCGKQKEDNFSIVDHLSNPISSASWARSSKDATFAAFMDLAKIKKSCSKYKMKFEHRMMYRVDGTVDLVGELQPGVATSVSYHEARKRKAKSSENRRKPTKHLFMEDINKKIDDFLAQVKAHTKSHKVIETEIKAIKTERKLLPAGDEQKRRLYKKLQDTKAKRNESQLQIFRLKNQLKELRSTKHAMIQDKVIVLPETKAG
jgi:hypothetical protein